ncbi:hypothetical protein BST81_15375 [Leptolyngbya sp. 'hensonii']|uniref:DUF11 domain-containing protein n=1 Tax=Leptolyngbya sp. 'hensonii' TaxID=1922337 RepID=UPI00094FF730|nr:DUF11 domain-containing protein [Leptolyngbya sp. 'hensonii']OLP17698.1 hypothetical protein BST81_15375 [Leptolyngbya sp. 'hensonii']
MSFQLSWSQRLRAPWLRSLAAIVLTSSLLPLSPIARAGISLQNRATATYGDGIQADLIDVMAVSGVVAAQPTVVPPGRITGCAGETLPTYTGFKVSLFDPLMGDPTGTSPGNPTPLTPTEVPDVVGNGIPLGLVPNSQNINLFPSNQGSFNFLLNASQQSFGKTYILVITPPAGSGYDQRRVQVTIGATTGNSLIYTATALDGKPLNPPNGQTSVSYTQSLTDLNQAGISLAVIAPTVSVCQNQALQIVKSGDRAAAEPGDTVIYRLAIRNLSSTAVVNLTVTDVLPLGFTYGVGSVRGESNGTPVSIATERSGSTLQFKAENFALPPGSQNQPSVLTIAYAATLTPDAIRGSGQNSAAVSGQRTDNQLLVKDGPSIHRLAIRAGILADCGTLIGRVFYDKNFDGEQQPGEPGLPNAVIFMDDGNRIVTDVNGLFSVANVIAGARTATLDLTSVPGYTLAPNPYFIERNSQVRLVRLEPGGLARINFGVVPAVQTGGTP